MTLSVYSPERFMLEALKQAQIAFERGEVPVGAVVICKNRIDRQGAQPGRIIERPNSSRRNFSHHSCC
jgi:tRNA(Arg) A34 adenosine deaminase TadA